MNTTTSDYISELKARLEAAERQVESLELVHKKLLAAQVENDRLKEQLAAQLSIAAKFESERNHAQNQFAEFQRQVYADHRLQVELDKSEHANHLQLSGLLNVVDVHGERVNAVIRIKEQLAALMAAFSHYHVNNGVADLASNVGWI